MNNKNDVIIIRKDNEYYIVKNIYGKLGKIGQNGTILTLCKKSRNLSLIDYNCQLKLLKKELNKIIAENNYIVKLEEAVINKK